jgi:hypothetical protein
MKKRLPVAIAVALVLSAVVAVCSASAATEFGSSCTANQITEKAVWVATGHSPLSPLPVTAPVSGVITEWKVNSNLEVNGEAAITAELPRILQQRLLVLKSNGPESFTVVGEAPGGPLNPKGSNAYLSRVPVTAGDYLGLTGSPYTLDCPTESDADTVGETIGGVPVGSTFKAQTAKRIQVPVTAKIEPDVDGDGFGDETQDMCPQSAAYQTPCPVVEVSSLSVTRGKVVNIYVSTSLSAPVAITGTVKLAKDKSVKLTAAGKAVAPGTLGHFQLTLTKPVRHALKKLSNKKALRLSIAASATNVTGALSTAKSTLKLRGLAKPVHHRHPKHRRKPKKK